MGHTDGGGQVEAITLIATRVDETGWCLQAMSRREGEHVWDVRRLRFERLTENELQDVVDVLISRALGTT